MSVLMGSAHGDENGKAYGGKAGDQTGREVSTENWYLHSKGWILLRAKDPKKAEKIAVCMERACKNNHIGYDQYQRDTLYNAAKEFGFDVSKVIKDVETDCSALVRVCCAFAGITTATFNTQTQVNTLMKTNMFDKYTDAEHCKSSKALKRGDILVTCTKGHTVVVLSDGSNIISKGDKGESVKEIQNLLIQAGYNLPVYGVDGDFGTETENAVKAFQKAANLTVTGKVDESTKTALKGWKRSKNVLVTGANVNVRSGAGTSFKILFTAHKNDTFEYISTCANGWYKIRRNGVEMYISNKYSVIE